jgi:chromosome segregation protein
MTSLKLDRLEISGFKSFVDPVSLSFAGGITAIVGPNGCGKSNISDAMTWVLGEQSAKSLRGTRMEDVIFAGSELRKPTGMAEVTLHLATDPAFPHSEDGRISIGRRVFRTGESRYTLNGRAVRLKETKDLLMDTGLGIRAYSVIEQGKVGMILSGKPQERRRLLEEAAGITRYKQRKRIAEIKLEEATANLQRLDDVISEVERSLRSLKRQASAARRYRTKQEEYRSLLRRVLAGRWSAAHTKLTAVAADLAAAQEREAGLAAELSRGEAELAAGRERLEELAAELSTRHQAHADLAATIEGRQQFLKASRERLGETGDRAAQSRRMAERRGEEIGRHREALDGHAARRGEMEAELSAAAQEVDRDSEQISAAEARLAEAEARGEEIRRRLLAGIDELNRLRSRRHQGQIELEKGNYRKQHLADELAEREHELGRAAEAVEIARETVSGLEGRIAAKAADLDTVKQDLDRTMANERQAEQDRRRLEDELADAERHRKLLTELGRAFAERRDRLAAALAEIDGLAAGEAGFLADRLEAVAGWERSLDFYLADLEHAVLLAPAAGAGSASDPAERALEVARALADGPGATVVAPLAALPEEPPAVDDPAVVLSLGQALGLPEALAAALPPAFLVEAPEDAARLARRHPGIAFISRQGFWAAGGAVHVEAAEAGPGVLERERELAALDETIPRLEGERDEVQVLLGRLVERRSALAREANGLEGELAKLRQELAVGQARRDDAAARHHRLGVERETVATEMGELERELARVSGSHEQLVAEVAEAERRHSAVEEEQNAAAEALDAARAERQTLKEASAGRRGRLDLLRERLDAHDREMKRLRAEVEDGERQVAEWRAEAARLDARGGELEGDIAAAEAELQAALESREDSGDRVVAAQERLDGQRGTIRGLERRIADLRERRDAVRAEVEELRVSQAGLKQDADHVAVTFREEFLRPEVPVARGGGGEDEGAEGEEGEEEQISNGGGAAAGAAGGGEAPRTVTSANEQNGHATTTVGAGSKAGAQAEAHAAANDDASEARQEPALRHAQGSSEEGAEDGEASEPAAAAEEVPLAEVAALLAGIEPPKNLAELEVELARTRAALERLGPVNVLAVEEYAEQEERHEFLTTQRADVADSVVSLKRTIREINATSSERFRTTFAQVNVAFGRIFERLFRGGEAEMRLLDDEDVLESGIEIVARPPGKRLQNIMLMSGGEKALTAIALLFALFETKPSPFCILDEVDAPLDDVNCLRFVELLEEMCGDTQFLVITHNKLTMEAASTLYGVTMQEKGVSKLVAVELDDVHPQRVTA